MIEELEYIISGWYDDEPLNVDDVQEMALQIRQYILETYGPPF